MGVSSRTMAKTSPEHMMHSSCMEYSAMDRSIFFSSGFKTFTELVRWMFREISWAERTSPGSTVFLACCSALSTALRTRSRPTRRSPASSVLSTIRSNTIPGITPGYTPCWILSWRMVFTSSLLYGGK